MIQTAMTANRKNSSLASLSLALGIAAVFFAQTRAALLLVLAVPLGVVAAYTAWLALRFIQQAPAAFKGRGAAIAGACLGGISTALSLYFLVAVWPRQHTTNHQARGAGAVQRQPQTAPQTEQKIVEGGQTSSFPNNAIAGTEDDTLYQSVRYDLSAYHLPMSNGVYRVTLKFCEPTYNAAGKRIFGVKLQGKPVIENLDIFAKVGKDRALDYTFENVAVTSGRLHIEFVHGTEYPVIAALAVEGAGFAKKINCGGTAYKDYEADPPAERLEGGRPPERIRRDFVRRGAPLSFAAGAMPEGPVTNFTSNLPIIIIDTRGQQIFKDGDTLVSAQVIDATNGARARVTGPAGYDGLGTVKLRGFSTLRLPKRSYSFHTVDAKTNQVKVPLLGLPKEEDWVLYAPYEDKTMIRDVLAYELSNKMGHYAPRTRFVELFLNTDGGPVNMRDYAGVYVLVEKIKRGKERVNVAKLDPEMKTEPDITGGYIIKRDHNERDESGFYTKRGGPYYYVYPKSVEITPEQKGWLVRYLNSFEMALNGSNFTDPKTGYAAYLDVDSFIDAHWLVEVSKNVDGFRYSSYLTKDRGGKLKIEPPWDWNRSFGNANYYGGWQPNNWYWTYLRPLEIGWYRRLSQDPAFAQRCADRWFELRKDVLNPNTIKARIDQLAAQLNEAQKRNFQRWPILGEQVTCNYYVGNSYEDEVRWLKNWIERRIAWIDGQMASSARKKPAAAVAPKNEVVTR